MTLDHGILSAPLAKRGDIHRDIAKAKVKYREQWRAMQREANLREAARRKVQP
jgi:chorismate mutase